MPIPGDPDFVLCPKGKRLSPLPYLRSVISAGRAIRSLFSSFPGASLTTLGNYKAFKISDALVDKDKGEENKTPWGKRSMQVNQKDRIITAKIVYYGPTLGGKTTNL